MSVLLISNPTKDTGLAVTRQAAAVLAGLGVPVLMPQPFANEFGSAGLTGVHFLPEADAYRAADQVVTIGGDGTLLRAGLSCMKHGKPVLGVNLGRTGFLATCEVGELTAKLKRLAAGEFTLANRRLLHAEAPADGLLVGKDRVFRSQILSVVAPVGIAILPQQLPVGMAPAAHSQQGEYLCQEQQNNNN